MTPGPPITLAIESSNPSRTDGTRAAVALVAGEDPDGLRELARAHLDRSDHHDDALVRAVASAATGAGVTPRDIGRIAVSVGPGGYTSVRIAVSVAKSIASVTGAVCVPVPTSSGVALALAGALRDAEALLCLAWKREETWAEPWRDGRRTGAARILSLAELAAFGGSVVVVEEAFANKLRAAHPSHKATILEPVFDPLAVARASFACDPVPAPELVPLYPRKPEAVRVWAERRSR